MSLRVDGTSLRELDRIQVQFVKQSAAWDRRIRQLRVHNLWQTAITIAWIAIVLLGWTVYR